jgi:response regulator RpfG family c-di-GMP phosphodiesterase
MKSTVQGKEILIIDDSYEMRLLARKVLEGDGASVLEASTVAEGIKLAQEKIPHLIILDLIIPGQTGFDWLMMKQSLPILHSIPILVLSGLNDNESVQKAVSMGVSDYLLKPFRSTILLQKVKKLIDVSTVRFVAFEKHRRPSVHLSISVHISMANETGIMLESPAKLTSESEVVVRSPLFDQVEIKEVITKTTSRPSQFTEIGKYVSELNLIGLNERAVKKLRSLVRGWK